MKFYSIVVDAMGSCGSLSHDVMRCDNPPRRRVLFETFPKLKAIFKTGNGEWENRERGTGEQRKGNGERGMGNL